MARDADIRCAAIAADQFGVISRAQALQAGLTPRMIGYRLKSAWAIAMPNVYTLPGSINSWEQKLKAAQLWAGDGSAVYRRSAAVLYEIRGSSTPHVEVVGPTRKRIPAGVIYRCSRLSRHDVRPYKGFIVTSVERTLIDLASAWSEEELAIGLDDALRRRLTITSRIAHRLEDLGREGRKGSGVLRKLLVERSGLDEFPESPLETKFLEFVHRHGLPVPQLQTRFTLEQGRVRRVDFFFPQASLVIELDSYEWHSGRRAWEEDLRRRNQLEARGLKVMHYTARDLVRRPRETAKEIASLLEPSPSAGSRPKRQIASQALQTSLR
jgi:very-short-patch-repair endonuclease